MAFPTPETITGGCLCGGVRYRINFSPDHDWNHGPHTCQCTQCRKNCGSLVYNFHSVVASELHWLSKETYAEYNSSPGCYRAFCKNCGSTIGWMDHEVNNDIELAVGCFDEEFLLGGRDAQDNPIGAFGVALANPNCDHFHIRNEIKGVTEQISSSGTKFWKGTKDGPLKEATS